MQIPALKSAASPAVHIEPFDPAKPAPLLALFEAQLREHGIATSPDDVLAVLSLLGQHPAHGSLLVAASDGSRVGVAYATSILSLEHGGWSGWLEEMYVLPSWRGQGVGTQLLAAVIAAGKHSIWKWTLATGA